MRAGEVEEEAAAQESGKLRGGGVDREVRAATEAYVGDINARG